MIGGGIEFREGTATKEDIHSFLEECDAAFSPNLSLKVDIEAYATKIRKVARTFEAWSGDKLVGLVAAYMNDVTAHMGFITSVSVAKNFAGRGIASALLDQCLDRARDEGVKAVRLEVSLASDHAIRMYRTFGFSEITRDGETMSMELNIDKTRKS